MVVHIEIDGKKLEVAQGQMIIEVADAIGISIPRFCYHKKLSIAANCRMCLVEVANAPKPLPACATPVSEGMKIYTTTPRAIDAQKAVMEFLLINHPLDCPICDQGGQCELQDVAMEYGQDVSQFSERKRVVKDKNIGPLISTDMTRCIHCTRCVRFGAEVAGARELGATGRGEFMEIGTYVEKSVDSEISGNVIDLCPVGALTSKPYRFQARAWELKSQPSISMHDCIGSHLFFHVQHNKVMRALPRENEALNEVWLSDRDRFSYEGLHHSDRLTSPWIKRHNRWEEVDWTTALDFAIEKLQKIVQSVGSEQIGAVVSPNSTVEELYLLQKLLRQQGCHNIDHRLRQTDHTHQEALGAYPNLGISLSDVELQNKIVLIGSDIRKEQPLISHRIRKATLQGGQVFAINPLAIDFNFKVAAQWVGLQGDMVQPLAEVVKALMEKNASVNLAFVSAEIISYLSKVHPSSTAIDIAERLSNDTESSKASVLLGAYAWTHPQANILYRLSRLLAHLLGASWGETSNGANSAGAWLVGALPHRLPFGERDLKPGLNISEMWQNPLTAYILLHCEPEYDCAMPGAAIDALRQAQTVIALTAYHHPAFYEYAEVILPVTPISEMTGTYVNGVGHWQSFKEAVKPLGQSKPAWKVLRVIANLWNVAGFAYNTSEEILAEIEGFRSSHEDFADNLLATFNSPSVNTPREKENQLGLVRLAPTSLYAVDGIVRRAKALQETRDAQVQIEIHPFDAEKMQIQDGQRAWIMQEGRKSKNPLAIKIEEKIPKGCALVAASIDETSTLGAPYGIVELVTA